MKNETAMAAPEVKKRKKFSWTRDDSELALLGLTGVPYLQVGVPGILSLYFDVFSSGVQALVFSLLTMVYIGNACPPPEPAKTAGE